MHLPSLRVLPLLLLILALSEAPRSQCANAWLPQGPAHLLDGDVHSVVRLPNGDLVIGGAFTSAGGVTVHRIARWDGTQWSALGGGVTSTAIVRALTALPNGDLVAAGSFTMAGGVAAQGIARWNGTSWSPLGSGVNGDVFALATLPNGDVVAAGSFTMAGGVSCPRIARWNGSAWSPLLLGLNNVAYALLVLADGRLVVGGAFTSASGVLASRIARWDGVAWSPLPGLPNGGLPNPWVFSLAQLPNGHVVAGGTFPGWLRAWNGTSWSSLGSGPDCDIETLAVATNGDLIAGGGLSVPGSRIQRWDGTGWSAMGAPSPDGAVLALATSPSGQVFAGGKFDQIGGQAAVGLAQWTGASWSPMTNGLDNWIYSIAATADGGFVAGGLFTAAGGLSANRIARWDGTSWSALGAGVNGQVNSVVVLPNGDIVAGGSFTTAGGVAADRIARWNGAAWSAFPSLGGAQYITDLAVLPTGEVLVAHGGPTFNVALWNGDTWSPLGSGFDAAVYALAVLPNGDVVAGGYFTLAGGTPANGIARWDGVSWSPMGEGFDGVHALAVRGNGRLVASGYIDVTIGATSRVAEWDGLSWQPLGSGMNNIVVAFLPLPNDDLLAGGYFWQAGGVLACGIARWNGTAWTPLGTQMFTNVNALAMLRNGQVAVGGIFESIAGMPSSNWALLTTTCPATADVEGAGCPSSGGSNTLTSTTLPWVDSAFHATGTGLPQFGLVIAMTSVTSIPQGAVPLAALLPQDGVAGCDLLVAPDILESLVTTTGTTQSTLFLHNTPPLVGVTFFHQMLVIDLNGLGNGPAVTSTNALRLTAGSF